MLVNIAVRGEQKYTRMGGVEGQRGPRVKWRQLQELAQAPEIHEMGSTSC